MSFLKNRIFLISIAILAIITIVICLFFYVLPKKQNYLATENYIPTKTKSGIEYCADENCLKNIINIRFDGNDCAGIPQVSLKDQCLYLYVVNNSWNYSYCEKISDDQKKSDCHVEWTNHFSIDLSIMRSAAEQSDKSKCDTLSTNYIKDICNNLILAVADAVKGNDPKICEKESYLREPDIGNTCEWIVRKKVVFDPLSETAAKNNNISVCESEEITKTGDINSIFCIMKVIEIASSDLCKLLKNQKFKENCYSMLALKTKDEKYCSFMENYKNCLTNINLK